MNAPSPLELRACPPARQKTPLWPAKGWAAVLLAVLLAVATSFGPALAQFQQAPISPASQTARAANGLGAQDGRLQPPSRTPNSVSSQAGLYSEHPQRNYADIEPLRFKGSGEAALQQLAELLRATPRTVLITQTPGYLHAEMQTRWLKFTDDLELLLDERAALIHVRSASRLGQRDFGANRDRVEALRARFEALQADQGK
jgi:uncharacterized protein (DUF1499 family)